MDIREALWLAGAISGKEIPSSAHEVGALKARRLTQTEDQSKGLGNQENGWKKYIRKQGSWLGKERDSLMVVASLIATMAFQVGVNPPGGPWQDTFAGNSKEKPHGAGLSIMADNYPSSYSHFLIYNTTSFVSSLSIILLLISGLPLNHKAFVWILMVIMWIAVTFTALTYAISVAIFTPSSENNVLGDTLGTAIFVWIGLMALLLVGHMVRLIVRMVKKLRQRIRRRMRSSGARNRV